MRFPIPHLLLPLILLCGCSPAGSHADITEEAGIFPWGDVSQRQDHSSAFPDHPPHPLGDYVPPDGLQVIFLDVGQGDAVLVRFPKGATMLVDGGKNGRGTEKILPAFEKLALADLDYIVATHADADHCGGLDEVVEGVAVEEVWENGVGKNTAAWWDFSDAVDQHGIPRVTVQRGDVREIDTCRVEILNADEGWGDSNGDSIVLSIECEGVAVLLTGDAHAGTQADLIDVYGADLQADLVKLPHHGSPDHDSELPSFVLPKVAVCSVGTGNSYGHPDKDVVAEWKAVAPEFYRTDQSGTVTVDVRKGIPTVSTEW